MLYRYFVLLNFIVVTAKTPNIISYKDVLLGAHGSFALQRSKNLGITYNEVFHKIQELRLLLHDDIVPGIFGRDSTTDEFQEDISNIVPSEECTNHTRLIVTEAIAGKQWAINMLDAAAKPGSNIEGGEVYWVGSYAECIHTVAETETDNQTDGHLLFDGQYCMAVIPKPGWPVIPVTPGAIPTGMRIGVCVPSTCQEDDVTAILNRLLDQLNVSARVGASICQKKLKYDTKAITSLFVVSLFIAAMLIGTVYDVVWKQMPKWRQTSKMPVDATKHQNRTVNIKDHSQSYENTPLYPKNRTQEEEGPVGKVLLAFSVYTNTAKIFTVSHAPGSITSIHGIRFITMSWIILGHTVIFAQSAAKNALPYTERAMKDWTFQVIANATVAVDTFFTISGLLVSYLILKELTKNKGRLNWFMFYFHRFWRLTPPYMLIIVVYVNLFPYWGAGPLWPQDGIEPDYCRNWWTNLLYINNLVNTKAQCMGWSWYLANDMQFYVLSPLIFIPFYYSRVAGAVSSLLFLLATTITSGVLTKQRGFPPSIISPDQIKVYDYFLDYYIKPYCRIGPYVIGLLAGYVLHKNDCKVRIPKIANIVGWLTATAVSLAVLYGLYNNNNGDPLTVDQSALYNAVHRTAWGMCVAWVVVACATGNGGFINSILSWPVLIPLSRLTYTVYLVHPVVMNVYYFGREQLFFLSNKDVIWAFFGNLIATYIIALPAMLAFEAPMMVLEKSFLYKKKSKP